jgi:hypothetical protein
MLHHDNANT